ncbi:hypothetical protein ACVW16_004828 [Bradyrhizobium sp. USDA 4474]
MGTPLRASDRLVVPSESYDQDLLWPMMESAGPSSSVAPTERHDRAEDLGVAVRSFDPRPGDRLMSAAPEGRSAVPSQDTPPAPFIFHNDRFTALFVPEVAMRSGVPLNLSGATIHSGSRPESGSQPSAQPANRPSPALLTQMTEQAAPASGIAETTPPSSSVAPTERHDRAEDLGVAVRSFDPRLGDRLMSAAPEGRSAVPSQDTPPAPFIFHNDRFTALFVPEVAMRSGVPLNLSGATIHSGSRPESGSQPSAQPANRPSPALLTQMTEQGAPASGIAETTPPAREIYAASFAVPEGFLHGTQPAPIAMISKLDRWRLLPDAAQPMKQYDIRGELYTALRGPGGPNDIRLIHHPQM